MKKNTPRTIDSYIEEAKTDILIYFFVYFALIIGVIALAYIEQEPFICCLTILFLLMFLQRVFTYNKINSIKKKIDEQGSLDKVQNIVFWNNNHYFLTEEYFVILNKNDVESIIPNIKTIILIYLYLSNTILTIGVEAIIANIISARFGIK